MGAGHEAHLTELGPGEAHRAAAALLALRGHHASEAEVAAAAESQRAEGYRLLAAFEDDGPAVAVAGFRLLTTLAWGRVLYVDDLSTLPAARRRGHARALLEALVALAGEEGCDALHLDSGVGPSRHDAHALYHAVGLRIDSHHLSLRLR